MSRENSRFVFSSHRREREKIKCREFLSDIKGLVTVEYVVFNSMRPGVLVRYSMI